MLDEPQNNELQDKNEKLRELNATKDKFFSIIAHDLKNPFSQLLSTAELLLNGFSKMENSELQSFLKILSDSSKHGYSLLENLLEWSRSQTGKIVRQPVAFNIVTTIRENIDILDNSLKNKNIQIEFENKNQCYVYADMNMISTVVRNLISNSIKFTYNGGKITINIIDSGDFAEISVADTGVGIAQSEIEKLFRIDVTHSTLGTEEEKGTGLGLILCKEFVEKNNGQIWVESTQNKGSRFAFTLQKTEAPNYDDFFFENQY